MASRMRYHSGVVRYIFAKTSASYPIEEGDLVAIESGVAYPASHYTSASTFKASFAGIAVNKRGWQTSEWGFMAPTTVDPGWVMIAVSGVWLMDAVSYAYAAGSLVKAYTPSSALSNQKVTYGGVYSDAIGKACPNYDVLGVAQTVVPVELLSQTTHTDVMSGQ
jgi:hypothetical protein